MHVLRSCLKWAGCRLGQDRPVAGQGRCHVQGASLTLGTSRPTLTFGMDVKNVRRVVLHRTDLVVRLLWSCELRSSLRHSEHRCRLRVQGVLDSCPGEHLTWRRRRCRPHSRHRRTAVHGSGDTITGSSGAGRRFAVRQGLQGECAFQSPPAHIVSKSAWPHGCQCLR